MTTKEDFEIEKIKLEIDQLKKPFWKNANLIISAITIIITALIGFNSYFIRVNQENVSKIKELEQKSKENDELMQRIEVENLSLQKTQIEIKAEENKNKYEQYAVKLNQLEKDISIKSDELIKQKKGLIDAKKAYDNYKEKVKKVTEYMAGYGPGYAKGILKSESGSQKLREIAELSNPAERTKEIETFVINVVNQTFTKYTTKKTGELELIGN